MKERVSKEIILAMKAKDKVRLNVLRYLKKLFIENDTSKKPIGEMEIVISYAKKVKDSMALYPEGSDQRAEIEAEVVILAEYLPEQLGEDTFTMMAQRAIKVIDQVVVEQMQGKVDLEGNTWLIPKVNIDVVKKKMD